MPAVILWVSYTKSNPPRYIQKGDWFPFNSSNPTISILYKKYIVVDSVKREERVYLSRFLDLNSEIVHFFVDFIICYGIVIYM